MDLKIENLERFMSSLTLVHLSPFVLDTRLVSILFRFILGKIYLFGLVQFIMINSDPFFLAKFVWKSKVSSKVKAFAWLVVHKKVNINDMLWLRRPYKSLSPD